MSDNTTQQVLENLDALHTNMVSAIRERFGKLIKTVGEYDPTDPQSETIKTPAILIELTEFRPAGRTSGGRHAVELSWAAHCILSAATDDIQRQVRNFGLQALCLIDGQRWGLPDAVERASELEGYPGLFKPGDKGFESWIVNWKQTVHMGEGWQLPGDGAP